MRELANQYVQVIGTGRIGKGGQWGRVSVRVIEPTRSGEPLDLERFLANPNPRLFDPSRLDAVGLTEAEWTSFRSAIREARDK